jgi:hypothetical protein
MNLQDALNYVDKHGIDMLVAPGSNLTVVAVSSKGGGRITEAKDFTVKAFVEQKLSKKEMAQQNVRSIDQIWSTERGDARFFCP